jgi:hypothetical protein
LALQHVNTTSLPCRSVEHWKKGRPRTPFNTMLRLLGAACGSRRSGSAQASYGAARKPTKSSAERHIATA